MKIYTRVGDQGLTKQVSGRMVPKTDAQIVMLGDIDELQSYLGVVIASLGNAHITLVAELMTIQRRLYTLEADVSIQRHAKMTAADTTNLEERIDWYVDRVPELKGFILPGGSQAGAQLQVARTVARRAERSAVALHRQQPLAAPILTYLNRLSDYLFVLARYVNVRDGYQEQPSKLDE
ncbi:cob(I)yrinic acid a,c-diamide adenosyltransferase [Levilactobacillus yonginensis]|uniref:cob(I)yrinic acid a,c-diamide adenosyltransferase n=1 Tax=Levilactobacillus yonginensis TaxID=1054041 RepID=UPI00345C990D